MKKEKLLKLGVYASGLITGSTVGVVSSTLLFPGLAPVILGSVGATIFSKLFVTQYEKRNHKEPIEIKNAEQNENFDFFKTNKTDELELNQPTKKKIRI